MQCFTVPNVHHVATLVHVRVEDFLQCASIGLHQRSIALVIKTVLPRIYSLR